MNEERPEVELVYDPSILEEYRKEHEPELEGGGSSWWYVCPECHGPIDSDENPCRHCGQIIIWR